MKKFIPTISLALVGAFTFSGCETTGQSALAGAATGAAVGGLLHGRGSDALAGAAIGAGAGALLGHAAKRERERGYNQGYYDSRYSSRDSYERSYPVGSRTSRYGIVRSPYGNRNLIDVSGIPRGAKVVDPSTDRIFINP
jgi:osmotically inducible lipoprotein OsmB